MVNSKQIMIKLLEFFFSSLTNARGLVGLAKEKAGRYTIKVVTTSLLQDTWKCIIPEFFLNLE